MHYEAMFRGDYIAAVEMEEGKPLTLTITGIDFRSMFDEKKKGNIEKAVVSFREEERGWVINKTNAQLVAAMFGPETNDWRGKRVTIERQQVRLGGKMTPGIRVIGSPDLNSDITATVDLPRKRPQEVRLRRTGGGGRTRGGDGPWLDKAKAHAKREGVPWRDVLDRLRVDNDAQAEAMGGDAVRDAVMHLSGARGEE